VALAAFLAAVGCDETKPSKTSKPGGVTPPPPTKHEPETKAKGPDKAPDKTPDKAPDKAPEKKTDKPPEKTPDKKDK
jgi:hypothetical protein